MSRKPSAVSTRPGLFRKTDEGVPDFTDTDAIGETEKNPKLKRLKRTYQVAPETIILLDALQLDEHTRTGHKPELSNLVNEAILKLGKERIPEHPAIQRYDLLASEQTEHRTIKT